MHSTADTRDAIAQLSTDRAAALTPILDYCDEQRQCYGQEWKYSHLMPNTEGMLNVAPGLAYGVSQWFGLDVEECNLDYAMLISQMASQQPLHPHYCKAIASYFSAWKRNITKLITLAHLNNVPVEVYTHQYADLYWQVWSMAEIFEAGAKAEL